MLPYFYLHKFTADEVFSKTHSRPNHFLSASLQKNRLNLQIEIPGFDGSNPAYTAVYTYTSITRPQQGFEAIKSPLLYLNDPKQQTQKNPLPRAFQASDLGGFLRLRILTDGNHHQLNRCRRYTWNTAGLRQCFRTDFFQFQRNLTRQT